jgi:hypothetical protein
VPESSYGVFAQGHHQISPLTVEPPPKAIGIGT